MKSTLACPICALTVLSSSPASSPNVAKLYRSVLTLGEAAEYIGVRPRTLRERKAGTRSIPRHSSRPVKFLRPALGEWKRQAYEREIEKIAGARKKQSGRAVPTLVRRGARKKG